MNNPHLTLFESYIKSYTKEKYCTFFGRYTSRDENETSKFPGKEGRIHLKAFPGAKAN